MTADTHCSHRLHQALFLPELDWNQLWKDGYLKRKKQKKQREYWNGRAHSFARHAERSPYVEDFLQKLEPQPTWSVLDVGCGAGTLALPLADKVQSITAIDFSDTMLVLLAEECRNRQLRNIWTHNVAWEDDWEKAGIGVHDVVISSRSLVPYDLRTAIEKLQAKARYRVVITTIVGHGPHDPRILNALGRELEPRPDYIYVLNLLYQMQIRAEVSFIVNSGDDRTYEDLDQAIASARWMVPDLNVSEELLLADFFKKQLIETEHGLKMRTPHTTRWAYISWNIE